MIVAEAAIGAWQGGVVGWGGVVAVVWLQVLQVLGTGADGRPTSGAARGPRLAIAPLALVGTSAATPTSVAQTVVQKLGSGAVQAIAPQLTHPPAFRHTITCNTDRQRRGSSPERPRRPRSGLTAGGTDADAGF